MKTLSGKVTSVKMHNTVVVEVMSKRPHPIYKKLITRSKKYKAHTTNKSLAVGNQVLIVETAPVSKDTYFKVQEVIQKEKIK